MEICHHIGATLLAAHYELSKTDSDCCWAPVPRDNLQTKTVDEVFNLKKQPRVTNRNLTEDEVQELYGKLSDIPPVGFKWILSSLFDEQNERKANNSENDQLLDSIDVAHLIRSAEFDSVIDKTEFLKGKLKLTREKVSEISKMTIGQSSNVDWLVVRTNRITASNFGKIISSVKRNRFPPSLFSSLYGK